VVKAAASWKGWKSNQIHIESFGAVIADEAENSAFDIVLSRSNKTLRVEEDMSILDALRNADEEVPYACLQGTCGTCVLPVLQGEIEHRDAYLTTDERKKGDRVCVCVSRCKTDKLVLDL